MKTPYQDEQSSLFQIAHGRLHINSKTRQYSHRNHDDIYDDEDLLNENNLSGLHVLMRGLYDDLEAVMAPKKKKPLFEEILQHLRDITGKMKRNIKRDQIKEEWKMVAKIVDRFLLIIFMLAIVSLTVTILYLYPVLATHFAEQPEYEESGA